MSLRRRAVPLVLGLALLIASCGPNPSETSTSSPLPSASTAALADASASAAASPAPSAASVAASAAPATTPAESAIAESTPAETAAADVPTVGPTITTGPTATPFPLQAGWWDDAVCYEVFVRSFYDSDGDGNGDLNGLIEKLDYINDGDPAKQDDLGATCIWLMPVAEAESYHGYDTTDYYTVERDFGTNDDFKRLIEAAHQRGIKVIIDLVLNHTSDKHPWFQEALKDPASPHRDWYIWSPTDPGYRGPWNDVAWHRSAARDEYYYGIFWSGMPDLDYRNPDVTAEAEKISAFWLNEMGADGFRLDAIKHLIEDGKVQENTPETHAWLRDYRTFLSETRPDAFTIGEIFGATPQVLLPYYPDQLDTYFTFEIGDKLVSAASLGVAGQLPFALSNTLAKLPYQRWAPFLRNHDQERTMTTLKGDVAAAKVAATALLTMPGLPFVYYGEELGMLGAKPDERIRTPMQWSGDANGGFSAGTPWQALDASYAETNVAAQAADPGSLLSLNRRLIQLHTSNAALGHGDLTPLTSSNTGVTAYVRQAGDEAILVLLNFGKQPAENVTLAAQKSGLAAGEYQLQTLLDEAALAPLTVGDGGAIAGYVPLPSLPAQSAYIMRIAK